MNEMSMLEKKSKAKRMTSEPPKTVRRAMMLVAHRGRLIEVISVKLLFTLLGFMVSVQTRQLTVDVLWVTSV